MYQPLMKKFDPEGKIKAGCKTIWTGVLEILPRVAFIGVSAGCCVFSSFILHTLRTNPYLDAILVTDIDDDTSHNIEDAQNLIDNTKTTAGFMIFLSVVTFIIEMSTILGLFILKGNKDKRFFLHFINAQVNILLVILFLSGAAASASYCSGWSMPPYVCQEAGRGLVNTSTTNSSDCEEDILIVCLAALSAIGFLGLLIAIFLTVWSWYKVITKKGDSVSNLVETSENGNAENKNHNEKETKA